MYPTRSTFEYLSEMNRLFPKTSENDNIYHTPNTTYSQFQQSSSINRSSSSAESTSSGSFPDTSQRFDRMRQTEQPFDTPFVIRRQRPIIGRKIFDNVDRLPPTLEQIPKPFEEDLPGSIWHTDDPSMFQHTPPKVLVEQKNYTQNVFYELFPEHKGLEYRTPSRSPASTYTPSVGNSPIFSPPMTRISPNSMNIRQPQMQTSPMFTRPPSFASSSRYGDVRPTKMCTFCRKNGETPIVYMTHAVKEKIGPNNQNVVTCPILRSHVCSTCGASGDNAHTITYCPILRNSNNGMPLQSTTITLKNTRVKSNGRRRY